MQRSWRSSGRNLGDGLAMAGAVDKTQVGGTVTVRRLLIDGRATGCDQLDAACPQRGVLALEHVDKRVR